ncbi:MAG TPA: hypothetical protein VFD43_02510 [Planctomycetota bacterium]|nr:hypothetical protein [Planctomycetota bacterium]
MLVLVLTAASLAAGCAVLEPANRRTLNAMDERWSPPTTAGRWAAALVAFPAAVVGLLVDALFVNPALAFDDAWDDTVEWLWTPDPDESRFRRAVILPLAAIATPFVYVGDWIRHGFFTKTRFEDDR